MWRNQEYGPSLLRLNGSAQGSPTDWRAPALRTRALTSIAICSGRYVQVLPDDLSHRVGRGSWCCGGSRCATCVIRITVILDVFSATGGLCCLGGYQWRCDLSGCAGRNGADCHRNLVLVRLVLKVHECRPPRERGPQFLIGTVGQITQHLYTALTAFRKTARDCMAIRFGIARDDYAHAV